MVAIDFTGELIDGNGNGFTAEAFEGEAREISDAPTFAAKGVAGLKSVSTGSGTFKFNDETEVAIETVIYTLTSGYYGDTYTFYLSSDPALRAIPTEGEFVKIIVSSADMGKNCDLSMFWAHSYIIEYGGKSLAFGGTANVTKTDDEFMFTIAAENEGDKLDVNWTGTPADLNNLPKDELEPNTFVENYQKKEIKGCFVEYDEESGINTYYVMATDEWKATDVEQVKGNAVFRIALQASDEGRTLDIASDIVSDGEYVIHRYDAIVDGTLSVLPSEGRVAIEMANAAVSVRMKYDGPVVEIIEEESDIPNPTGWWYAFGEISEVSYKRDANTTTFTFFAKTEANTFTLSVDNSYLTGNDEYVILEVGGNGAFFSFDFSFFDEDIEDTNTFHVSNTEGGKLYDGTKSGNIRLKFFKTEKEVPAE